MDGELPALNDTNQSDWRRQGMNMDLPEESELNVMMPSIKTSPKVSKENAR